MARPPSEQPTEGEMEILNILWNQGPSELGKIRNALLEKREVASTTVATMLKLMEGKGLVERREGGRIALWAAKVDREVARQKLVSKLLQVAFDSSAPRLFAHMLESGKLEPKEIDALRHLLDQHKGSNKGKSKGEPTA